MKRDIYSLTSLKILGNRTETAGSVGSARQGGFACPSIISQFCFFTTSLLSTLSWHSYSLRDSTSQGFQPQTNELDWLRFAQLIQSLLRGSGQAWVIYAPLLLAVESVLFEPHRLKINENIFLKENGVVAKRRGNISGQAKTTDIFMSSVNAWISDRWMDGWTDGLGGWMDVWMNAKMQCPGQGSVWWETYKKNTFLLIWTVRALKISNSFGSLPQKRDQEIWGKWLEEDYWKIGTWNKEWEHGEEFL